MPNLHQTIPFLVEHSRRGNGLITFEDTGPVKCIKCDKPVSEDEGHIMLIYEVEGNKGYAYLCPFCSEEVNFWIKNEDAKILVPMKEGTYIKIADGDKRREMSKH